MSQLLPNLQEQLVHSDLESNSSSPTRVSGQHTRTGQGDVNEKEDYILVEFEVDDPRDPFNFSPGRKWAITMTAVTYTMMASWNLSSFAIGITGMKAELGLSTLQAAFGIALYAWGFAFAPLILAPFSEEWGRNPLYIGSAILFVLFAIPVALAQNLATVLVARFIQGCAASTGSTMVGGSLTDIWKTKERGLPMSIFSLFAIGGTGLGAFAMSFVAADDKLGWRWIQWITLILIGGGLIPAMLICMKETRSTVLLTRLARKKRKETNNPIYRSPSELTRPPLIELIKLSLKRPLVFLFTEPVVFTFSLWISFVWGILYGIVEAIPYVFEQLYGFGTIQMGLVYLSLVVASFLGFGLNFYQDHLYKKNFAARGPEARLYGACLSGMVFAIGCFIFGWTSYPDVHWIGPIVGLTVAILGLFVIYLSVFNYLADAYLIYASSALAAQSLSRNIFGGAFPLFITPMYRNLNPRWSATIFGCLAALMGIIPFVLFHYGPRIRAQSRIAKTLQTVAGDA
ncbi:Synaptic vesicle transporter SVOP and related transporters (major facilitator superfamily) [Phaffia rhodozyma]|uniref:Synaptic vesicle transporter SVOP and related transporters (Major facilitator superfamily) n=1 Tax=Phaffia rhodozyma TaxID=264483 RepID=A0A0F7SUI2_PHARH|nr:Synaptic vesicle transporter SVOP and related transporters (major facilitator superfamily) [Phaffia rhodozyma]